MALTDEMFNNQPYDWANRKFKEGKSKTPADKEDVIKVYFVIALHPVPVSHLNLSYLSTVFTHKRFRDIRIK